MTTYRAQKYKPGDFSLGQVHEFLGAFGRKGGTPELLQLGIEDERLMNSLIRFLFSGGYEATITQRSARLIMDTNFFGIEEAIQHFGVKPTKTQLAILAEIPFTEAVLQECRDTHILVAIFPLSILDIRKRVERKLFFSHDDVWYNVETFAREKGRLRWHLILKRPVLNSTNKLWNEQQALLKDNEETPDARCMVYTIIGHYLATGKRLFFNVFVCCSNLASNGYRFIVGCFGRGEDLRIAHLWDSGCHDVIGLASYRKPQS